MDEGIELDKNKKHNIDVVIDRIIKKEGYRSRLIDSLEVGLKLTGGEVIVANLSDESEKLFSEHLACPICGFSVPKLEPSKIIFNSFLEKSFNGLSKSILYVLHKIKNLCHSIRSVPTDVLKYLIPPWLILKFQSGINKSTSTSFLNDVGLGYLTLSRKAGGLSGGEAQRIRLATQIGSRLTGVLYVLDEPSIGLHQRDNDKLIATLQNIRDLGNSVLVVEHDEDTMRASDFIVDIGPGAGVHGGKVIVAGTPEEVMACKESITGQYLSGRLKIDVPKKRRKGNGNYIWIKGAKENNLKNINVKFPLGCMCVVTGVSGSGKSTLVNEIMGKAMMAKIYHSKEKPGKHKEILGLENIDKVIEIRFRPSPWHASQRPPLTLKLKRPLS